MIVASLDRTAFPRESGEITRHFHRAVVSGNFSRVSIHFHRTIVSGDFHWAVISRDLGKIMRSSDRGEVYWSFDRACPSRRFHGASSSIRFHRASPSRSFAGAVIASGRGDGLSVWRILPDVGLPFVAHFRNSISTNLWRFKTTYFSILITVNDMQIKIFILSEIQLRNTYAYIRNYTIQTWSSNTWRYWEYTDI